MPASVVLVSAVLPAAIEPATFRSSGDAIAAVPTIINFRLVKPELSDVIQSSFIKYFLFTDLSVFRSMIQARLEEGLNNGYPGM